MFRHSDAPRDDMVDLLIDALAPRATPRRARRHERRPARRAAAGGAPLPPGGRSSPRRRRARRAPRSGAARRRAARCTCPPSARPPGLPRVLCKHLSSIPARATASDSSLGGAAHLVPEALDRPRAAARRRGRAAEVPWRTPAPRRRRWGWARRSGRAAAVVSGRVVAHRLPARLPARDRRELHRVVARLALEGVVPGVRPRAAAPELLLVGRELVLPRGPARLERGHRVLRAADARAQRLATELGAAQLPVAALAVAGAAERVETPLLQRRRPLAAR